MIVSTREPKPYIPNPAPNITKVLDAESEEKLLSFLENTKDFGFDIETTPVKDYFWRRTRTIQFGNSKEQYVVDLKDYADGNLYDCQGNYGKNLQKKAPRFYVLLQKLSPFLCSDKWVKTGVNLGFEYECLYWQFGIRTYGFYDCMLAEKCIYAGLGGHASLKNYEFFAMDSMFLRYFGYEIDKTLQTSFNLDDELTDAQYEYAALDVRIPLAIKTLQQVIADGETPASLRAKKKPKLADYLDHLDNIIFGDNLNEIIQIENNAIGSFIDMHVHGERIDREKWLCNVQCAKDKLVTTIQELDKIFLPIVGYKNEAIDDVAIIELEKEWKNLSENQTDEEIALKLKLSPMRRAYRKDPVNTELYLEIQAIESDINKWETARKEQKEILKTKCGELKKRRTKINNLKGQCEGEALINYSSDAQLLKILKENFKKLEKLESLDDAVLEKHEQIIVMKLIREYHGLSKTIGTYGDAWATEWTTHPCKEEGWLHPGDGKLHCTFNQLDAGTGRSSSSQPNGQNLPQEKETRSCFIVDPPDEEEPEGYDMVTCDMSGAELRIIAEDANDPVWIGAFNNDEDLHSVGTELLFEDDWIKKALPDCDYFKLNEQGKPKRHKCDCLGHKELRGYAKAINFLLAYGGGAGKLAKEIKKPLKEAKHLMEVHEQKNPAIWAYLKKSGDTARMNFKAFDLYGRRRLLPEPTTDRVIENCKEYNEKELRLSEEECKKNTDIFLAIKGRFPKTLEEKYEVSHRPPTAKERGRSYIQMSNSITRQGKNHRIQGTNATIAKIAMGCSYDKDGNPFLWHTLPLYKAKLVKFVHDELVVQCPKRFSKEVAALVGDAFKRAAAIKMKKVVMEFDFKISNHWEK